MIRIVIYIGLIILLARALSKLWGGIMEGLTGEPRTRSHVPQRGVQMVRDPVCGTFVLPDHALTVVEGRARVFFCSDACRDKYRARTA